MSFAGEWSDFYPAPPISDITYQFSVPVAGTGVKVTALQTDTYDSCVLQWFGGLAAGQFAAIDFRFAWESSGVTNQTQFVVTAEGTDRIVLPMSTQGNWLVPWSIAATATPYNFVHGFIARNGLRSVLPFGLTSHVISSTVNIGAGANQLYRPSIFVPGMHQLWLSTALATYTVALEYATQALAYVSIPIASNAAPLPAGFEFVAPAGSWQLRVTNTTGGAGDVQVLAVRRP